jgi:ornithine cyclodeaminase/alanine dehydrogenase-like protein (mu-crystallin family)
MRRPFLFIRIGIRIRAMLILNANEVRQALPMAECVTAMRQAYAALSGGKAEVPLRMRLPVAPNDGMAIFMPAFVNDEAGQALAVKIVSLFNKNPARGLPLIQAAVLVLNAETGEVEAMLEGGTLTAIRTGAGCGAATDVLARKDAKTVAIFGAGVQARTQLEAVCAVRDIEAAWIYSPNTDHAAKFIEDMSGKLKAKLHAAASPAEAMANADIVSAATTSHSPVFAAGDVRPGVHINAAGTHTAEGIEVPAEVIAKARVTVDSRSATQVEAGEIAIPLREKLITESDIAEIGEVILGKAKGRSDDQQVTFFKSVGVAVQDAMAGRLALTNARRLGLGTEVAF